MTTEWHQERPPDDVGVELPLVVWDEGREGPVGGGGSVDGVETGERGEPSGDTAAVGEPAADRWRWRRGGSPHGIPRPVIAAAAAVGLSLMGLSVVLAGVPAGHTRVAGLAGSPRGYTQPESGWVFTASGAGGMPGGMPGRVSGHPAPGSVGPAVGLPQSAGSASLGMPAGAFAGSSGAARTSAGGSVGVTTGAHAGVNSHSDGSSGTAASPRSPAATYSGVAGPGCGDTGTGFQAYGWFDDGESGFLAHSGGGLAGDGCPGGYDSVPMSGDASSDDTANYVLWTFHTGAVNTGTCQVDVYIPGSTDVVYVGGHPSYYTVQNAASAGTDTVGAFSVSQVAERGRWAGAGTYPVSGGLLVVMLHSRGLDWNNSGVTHAHHAADAVAVSCTA